MSRWAIRQAARVIYKGGVIAYPTEAVYGLGCNPFDAHAVAHLLQIKQRDPAQGLILIGRSLEDFEPFIQPLSEDVRSRVLSVWPGPVTWLVPASAECPAWVRGQHETIAIRATAHRQTRDLCDELGMPLVSTSANRAGQPAAVSSVEVRRQLGRELGFILGGPTDGHSRPSQIQDALTGKIIRR